MRAKVNMLFDAVSPHIVCKDLGFKIFIDKNSMSYVKDPHNNCQITILTREFVSKNFNINFIIRHVNTGRVVHSIGIDTTFLSKFNAAFLAAT